MNDWLPLLADTAISFPLKSRLGNGSFLISNRPLGSSYGVLTLSAK